MIHATFVNTIVKQGNSLCVRIPHSIVKEQSLDEGDQVTMQLQKTDFAQSEEGIQQMVSLADRLPKLRRYSTHKKRMFAFLLFEYLQQTQGARKQSLMEQFYEEYSREFGRDIMDEFVEYFNHMYEEAFIEEDGIIVTKPEYR